MANNFVPFDLKIRDITHGTVILEWDLDNQVEFKPGVYYNVFTGAISGGPYTFFGKANIKYISIPKDFSPFYVVVSSIVPGMGESAQSTEFEVTIERGVLDVADNTTIALTPDGRPVKLRATNTGELIISGGSVNANISGFATEAAQQQQLLESHADALSILGALQSFETANHNDLIAVKNAVDSATNQITLFKNANNADLTALKVSVDAFALQNTTDLNGFAAQNTADMATLDASVQALTTSNHNDFLDLAGDLDAFKIEVHNDAITTHGKLDDIITELGVVADNNYPQLMREVSTQTNVTPAGVTFSLPWKAKSKIMQLTALKEAGSAVNWTLEILDKTVPTAERNVVIRTHSYTSYDPNRLDILQTIPYINLDGTDLIWIRLTPDVGTSNTFYIAVSGEEAK